MQPVNGRVAAEAARAHFDLQLRFAEALTRGAGLPWVDAMTFQTQLHRRRGYGNVARMPPDPAFLASVGSTNAPSHSNVVLTYVT